MTIDIDKERAAFIAAYRLWWLGRFPGCIPEHADSMAETHWIGTAGAMWRQARAAIPSATFQTDRDIAEAKELWECALAHAAMYVENHCVDGEDHAYAIMGMPLPKITATSAPDALVPPLGQQPEQQPQPSCDEVLIPCAYRVGPVILGAVKIEECGQIEGPPLWAVRHEGNCLGKEGYWTWEPSPSNRDDEFLDRCRFHSATEAYAALSKWRAALPPVGQNTP